MSEANFQGVQNPYAAPYAEVGEKPFDNAGPVASFRGFGGFWIRLLAYMIDCFVVLRIFFVCGIVGAAIGFALNAAGFGDASAVIGVISFYLLLLGASIGYFVGMVSSSNQGTLGKMALGLKVVDLQGRRVSFWRSFGRTLAMGLSNFLAIGYIMIAFTERKQALHDMIAGTLVVKTR